MKATWPLTLSIGLLCLLPAATTAAGTGVCTARSPDHTVALLELFTSEGCSSCPPADRWLSSLREMEQFAGRVVPLALHVDYWDYIGWKDAFAQAGFAARQRRLVQRAGSSVIYTPQFFMQGKPFRPPASAKALASDLAAIGRAAPKADIGLTLEPVTDGRLTVKPITRIPDERIGEPLGLFIALYENGLTSRVNAGENRGAILRHDFVVREWIGPKPLPASGEAAHTITIPLAPGWQTRNLGIAAFIQNTQTQEVLQAIALPFCR